MRQEYGPRRPTFLHHRPSLTWPSLLSWYQFLKSSFPPLIMKWLCWKIIKMIKWLWNKRQLESWTHEIGTITICGPEKYRFTYYTCGSISAPIISPQSSYPSFHYTNTNHPHKYRLRLSHTGNWMKYLYWTKSRHSKQYTIQYTVYWQITRLNTAPCWSRCHMPQPLFW